MNAANKMHATALLIGSAMLGTTTAYAASRSTIAAGYWTNTAIWASSAMPANGDDVSVGHAVTLDVSPPALKTFANTATLTFVGWNTALTATVVTVNGTITHPTQGDITGTRGVYADWTPSNRVWIVCSNLTVNTSKSIDVSGKGYIGGRWAPGPYEGKGPGGGWSASSVSGGGGSHGGGGGLTGRASRYGSATAPIDPGSGGAGDNWNSGGNGGGAVRVEASGLVTVHGTITANGNNANHDTAGGGSGGSIHIACRALAGSGGTISANGGAINGAIYGGGGGGGGRLAVVYEKTAQASQNAVQKPNLTICANQGGRGYSYSSDHGEPGTIYLSDASFFPTTSVQGGIVQIDGVTALTLPSLTISGGMFGVSEGTTLTVLTNVTTSGRGGLFVYNCGVTIGGNLSAACSASDFGQSEIYGGTTAPVQIGGNVSFDRARLHYANVDANIQSLLVGGNFTLTNGAPLYVSCGPTNGVAPAYGARVHVGGTWRVATNSTVSLQSHATNYSTPLFEVGDLLLAKGATIQGDGLGYPNRAGQTSVQGYGPGGGQGGGNAGGGGHGGKGGNNTGSYGKAYDVPQAPVAAGSGGGQSYWSNSNGGDGGSCLRLAAERTVTVNGTITMNGTAADHSNYGGGAGGGVYIRCRTFAGNGVIRAIGGNGGSVAGGGGGGLIAIWSQRRTGWTGTLADPASVAAGTGGYGAGATGSLKWIDIPATGTTFLLR